LRKHLEHNVFLFDLLKNLFIKKLHHLVDGGVYVFDKV